MFRTRPLAAAVLCTAALAACSDSPAASDRGGDPLVNATNRNLPEAVVFEATQSDEYKPGGPAGLQPSAVCYYEPQPYSVEQGSEGDQVNALPCEEPDPYAPTPPTFAYPVVSITGSTSSGVKTVDLSSSGSFTYASFGQLTTIFQNVGGCPTTAPSEYSRSTVTGENAPFTLSSSRTASYNGTTAIIKWGVSATSYAESPEGGSGTKSRSTTYCY